MAIKLFWYYVSDKNTNGHLQEYDNISEHDKTDTFGNSDLVKCQHAWPYFHRNKLAIYIVSTALNHLCCASICSTVGWSVKSKCSSSCSYSVFFFRTVSMHRQGDALFRREIFLFLQKFSDHMDINISYSKTHSMMFNPRAKRDKYWLT